ncbi:MAG TPA: ParB/RepB/Spo0J family partition protein [Stellaceae bacterium]|jgi:ParB family chromosome partitioning protein|nr:ParB/RepB/Spo0J family partition protein [Stellaceae bacterium]
MSEEPRPRMMARGLGRGLSALLGEGGDETPKALRQVATELLQPGRFQPRRHFDQESLDALADSVRAQGILQPILVRRSPENPNTYEILAGERRWRAAQAARLHEVPVLVRELGDREASEIALVENVQRQDLNPVEEAQGYRRLIDEFGHTQEALASALGKSRSHIANTLRLLTLPDEIQTMIADGRLTAGHARALVTVSDPLAIAQEIIAQGLNVRQTEGYVRARDREGAEKPGGKRSDRSKDPNVAALEQELAQLLGLKATIRADDQGGVLSIRYRTLDQLDLVLARLRGPR